MKVKPIFSVSEFNEFIRLYLNQVGEVTVEGEISEIKVSQNQWLFINLKDKEANLNVFGVLDQITNFEILAEGMLVHVWGEPTLHQKSSKFSLRAYEIIPAGEGALKLALEKLKLKLTKEGLFALERKRPLPLFPQKIGLITAKNSQAYADFVKVLTARMGGLKIYFYPVSVQGRQAVSSILEAFAYFNQQMPYLDLLVLVRGGGSLEDLQAFNDERVVRAIFASKIPVVCGVGHEKDITLADLVADLRASTPSNAAELIVRHRQEIGQQINHSVKFMAHQIHQLIREKQQTIQLLTNRMKSALTQKITAFQNLFSSLIKEFALFQEKIKQAKINLANLLRLLKNLDYRSLLRRGFSITFDKGGNIIKTIKQVKFNEGISTLLFDGKIFSKVKAINP